MNRLIEKSQVFDIKTVCYADNENFDNNLGYLILFNEYFSVGYILAFTLILTILFLSFIILRQIKSRKSEYKQFSDFN